MRTDAAQTMLKRRLKQAGLPAHYSPHSFRATGITNFRKMTVLLKPLSESLAMPIAALQNSTTAAAKRCFSKIWSGLGTELEFKESRENFARSILTCLVAIILQMFSNGLNPEYPPDGRSERQSGQEQPYPGRLAYRLLRMPAGRVLIRGMHDNLIAKPNDDMNPGYISAFAALAGSLIGGLTTFAAAWVTQRQQANVQWLLQEKTRRQELYQQFIEEASKLYVDALICAR